MPDALPHSTFAHRTTVLSAWFHCDLGLTPSRIPSAFDAHLHFQLTDGGVTAIWHRLASIHDSWYRAIRDHCLKSGVLPADQIGWRVDGGRTHDPPRGGNAQAQLRQPQRTDTAIGQLPPRPEKMGSEV